MMGIIATLPVNAHGVAAATTPIAGFFARSANAGRAGVETRIVRRVACSVRSAIMMIPRATATDVVRPAATAEKKDVTETWV